MDFFQSQNDSRQESKLLMAAFAVVFLFCFAIIYFFAQVATRLSDALFPWFSSNYAFWVVITAFATVIVRGCYNRWQDVSDGGQQFASRMGAYPVSHNTQDRAHRLYCHLVEEMSIAAGISVPDCFILTHEGSINAFVAGNRESTVIVVTKGAVGQLAENELRAVVAHELAHIKNNDLGISMKLLIALGGLNAISVAGRACFTKEKLNPATLVIGALLCIVGWIFTSLGHALKAAVSRKRELLADAKAVQFTRDTWSIASALNKISESGASRGLLSRYSEEVAHMCIDAPARNILFPTWLATHPPLQDRILKIDPHFRVKQRKISDVAAVKHDSDGKGKNAARTTVKPDVTATQAAFSLKQCGTELSVLFSLMIHSAGYNAESSMKKYESTLKCYTNEVLPMRNTNESGIQQELDNALTKLVQLPSVQRQNLLDHLAELADHDNIQTQQETELLLHIYSKLNPHGRAA